MTEAELVAWLNDLIQRAALVPAQGSFHRETIPGTAWLSEARTALEGAFPAGHALRASWNAIFERAKTHTIGQGIGLIKLDEPHANTHFLQAVGVLQAAAGILKAGRHRTLIEGVRVETVAEVLDQAEILLTGQHVIAAAVLAGGALETHLLHLCKRNGLTWTGDGSISKYDQAIGQARNAGRVEVYKATDSKLVIGWAGIRNDAAHEPTKFTNTVSEVRGMVQGIREVMARVP